jgi:signal transduction histidine kinase
MDARLRDRLAIGLAMVAVFLATITVGLGRFDPGVRLFIGNDGRVVVTDVPQLSLAYGNGLRPGMIVTALHGVTLIRLPQLVYPNVEPSPDPDTGDIPPLKPTGVEPAVPTIVAINPATLQAIVDQPATDLEAIQPWDLELGSAAAGWPVLQIFDYSQFAVRDTAPAIVIGSILMLAIGWWLASGRAGTGLRPLAVPLAVATGVAFVARPLDVTSTPVGIALGGALITLAMVPLAIGLMDRIEDETDRRLVAVVTVALTAGGLVLALVAGFTDFDRESFARWLIVGAIPIVPGIAAAGPVRSGGLHGATASTGRLLESAEYAVAGVTPFVALNTGSSPTNLLFPLSVFWILVFLAGRFTVRPLARLVSRTALQRDLVVAATEAERARVAADIHDDALQELTILVHRLDAAGDTEGAEIARTVSDRLRAICGDLRLPILDDLGVGPALDWLVLRIERLAGGEVRLERTDGTRPPAAVELAFFRVAQEALSNAVKHGRPPIVVRYSASTAGASLSIDDAGTGIEPAAAEPTEGTGHFGLLNMQQRAEAIGAILDVRRWPAGGTHVKLDWRAH